VTDDERPRRQRRKEARPGQILEAARAVFSEKGYDATNLDDVAQRAQVSKGTLYVYFSSKEQLFHAVAQDALVAISQALRNPTATVDRPQAEALPRLFEALVELTSKDPSSAVVRMILSEGRRFPDLARIWHDDVVRPMLEQVAAIVAQAQRRGEVVDGDPLHLAFAITSSFSMALLFREIFEPIGWFVPDLEELAQIQLRALTADGRQLDS
jgi:AcrR family transcriptional regulator